MFDKAIPSIRSVESTPYGRQRIRKSKFARCKQRNRVSLPWSERDLLQGLLRISDRFGPQRTLGRVPCKDPEVVLWGSSYLQHQILTIVTISNPSQVQFTIPFRTGRK